MNRNEAGRAIKRCDYLSATDKLVFVMLLEGSDNGDCAVPATRTPSMSMLSAWTSSSPATVKRAVRHLELHGWISRKVGRGRGHKSSYSLVSRTPDLSCHCEKGSLRTPLVATKGVTVTPERAHSEPTKGSRGTALPQVNIDIARREAGKKGDVSSTLLQCMGKGCTSIDTQITRFGGRMCREHAGPQWKETA